MKMHGDKQEGIYAEMRSARARHTHYDTTSYDLGCLSITRVHGPQGIIFRDYAEGTDDFQLYKYRNLPWLLPFVVIPEIFPNKTYQSIRDTNTQRHDGC